MPSIPTSDALSEARPASIQDLFNRPPPLPPQHIDQLILYYRTLREQIASSTTVRHTRVKGEPRTYSADFSDL